MLCSDICCAQTDDFLFKPEHMIILAYIYFYVKQKIYKFFTEALGQAEDK